MKRRKFIQTNAGFAAALLVPSVLAQAQSKNKKTLVGFSKTELTSCIKSKTKTRQPLQAICASIKNGDSHVILLSLDMIGLDETLWESLRENIAKDVNLNPAQILIHTTHTHSAPWGARGEGTYEFVNLKETLTDCAKQAIDHAQPASIRTGISDVGKSLSIYRRGDTGADLGVQTFWFGYTFRENDDRPDASALINEMKSRWLGKKPNYKPAETPVWFDGDVDSLVHTMNFENADGEVIGSIVRFSAHPHLTCACIPWMYDPDFPGVVRRVVQQETNAPVMFITGACGDLVPKEKVKYMVNWDAVPPSPYMGPSSAFYPENEKELLNEVDRIGTTIANVALESLKSSSAQEINYFGIESGTFDVPLDAALPKSQQEIELIRNALVAEYQESLRQGNPLREMRGLANRLNWVDWAGSASLTTISDKERKAGVKEMPLSVMVVNKQVFIFMHSEIPVETTFELRKAFPQLDIWTMGLTNADMGYIPTARMIDEGGYEGRSTIIARNAEEKIRKDVESLVARLKLV